MLPSSDVGDRILENAPAHCILRVVDAIHAGAEHRHYCLVVTGERHECHGAIRLTRHALASVLVNSIDSTICSPRMLRLWIP